MSYIIKNKILLNQIIADLKPNLVIEDTYPDEWYLSVPALQNVPKILVLRRIDPLSFDKLRREGYFSLYDRILAIQDRNEFSAETHLPENTLLVKLSDIFRLVGPVFHLPTSEEIAHIKKKYNHPDKKLVVVSAGAGGDQFDDAYCEYLFTSMGEVAHRFLDLGENIHFVIVVGPYYRGIFPKSSSNITITGFEPYLSALLHVADVAILRPGYNVTQEALSGKARLIVVPDIFSYMESQHLYAEYLMRTYEGIWIGSHNDVNLLFNLTQKLLDKQAIHQLSNRLVPCQNKIAKAIIDELDSVEQLITWTQRCAGVRVFLLIGNVASEHRQNVIESLRKKDLNVSLVNENPDECCFPEIVNLDFLIKISQIDAKEESEQFPILFLEARTPVSLVPETLVEKGARVLLYTNKSSFGFMASDWCDHYSPTKYGLLDIQLYHFQVMPGYDFQYQLSYRVSKLSIKENLVSLYIDFSLLTSWIEISLLITALSEWIHSTPCHTISPRQLVRLFTISQLT